MEVFQSDNIPKSIAEHAQISKLIKQIRKKVFREKAVESESDRTVSAIVHENNCSDSFHSFLPIEQILRMPREDLVHMFSNSEYLLKVFLVLDPFEQEKLSTEKHTSETRNKIVEKVFDLFAGEEEKHLSSKYPNFICFKTEFALHFFYDKFRDSKNVAVLRSLRMLFIWTLRKFDESLIQQIEKEIIDCVSDCDQLTALYIEFYLFWVQNYNNFEFRVDYLDTLERRIIENHRQTKDKFDH